MGQTLSSPATQKKSESGANENYIFAVTEMQGWRITMEDAHATVLSIDDSPISNTFFAVYDGHGGGTVAKFAGKNVHKRLVSEEAYRERRYEEALKRAFLGTDEDIRADPAHTRDPSGCTAVAALVTTDGTIYVANAGDSRSVLSVKGEVKPLSFDHKPSSDTEKSRIIAAGGFVEYGRVNGNLALSRALGDFEFKKNYSLIPQKQIITSDPDVTAHKITDDDEFLVLACDGIWDCLTSQQVVNFVRLKVSEGKELAEIGEMLCDLCLAPDTGSGAGIGCDNMTVLIVALLHGRTKEQWYEWITDRVKSGYGYTTPTSVPQIYPQSRLNAFRARQEAQAERERLQKAREVQSNSASSSSSSLLGATTVRFLELGGITLPITTTRVSFGRKDDIDDDSDDDLDTDRPHPLLGISRAFGRVDSEESPDATQSLRNQLDEFETDFVFGQVDDEDSFQSVRREIKNNIHELEGEAPPPPKLTPNGIVAPVQQLQSDPLGDEVDPVVRADGLLDKSEDPLKTRLQ